MVVLMLRPKWLVVLAAIGFIVPGRGDLSSSDRAGLALEGTGSQAAATADPSFVWGVCGHPTWSDYADWVPGNLQKEMGYVRQLGCTYFRCSFERAYYPAILNTVVPPAQAAGVTILPILPLSIAAKEDGRTNYEANYKTATAWASYAIAKHYRLPFWELGNELENGGLVRIIYDGTAPDQFPDKVPGGFVAIASSLSGAYHGIQDAYAAGRASGETTVVPQMLYGCAYRHWGLLSKIQKYNGSLPFDIISWHWYEPNCGSFNEPIHDGKSFSKNRSPAECLADFKSHTNPGQPMEVWITESNRSVHTRQGYDNGSVSSTSPGQAGAPGQDWAAEAQEIQVTIDDVKKAPTVKGLFVYELLDEPRADGNNPGRLRSEGYYGLLAGLNGPYKDAFYTYQNEIRGSP
jgi:hypothetical protein